MKRIFLTLIFLLLAAVSEARYFAEIKDGVVKRVIVADSKEWGEKNLGGEWVETFIGRIGKRYAGPGYTYDQTKDNFIPKKPFQSWILNQEDMWVAPVASPFQEVGSIMRWDESSQSWK